MDISAYGVYALIIKPADKVIPGLFESLHEYWDDLFEEHYETIYIIITLIVIAYLSQTFRFFFKLQNLNRHKRKKLFIGPIKIRGDISNAMNSKGFSLALRTEFLRIRLSLSKIENENPKSYHAPATGVQTGYCFAGLRIAAPIPKSFFEEIGSESIEQDFTFKLGKVTIPVSEIWNSLLKIISVLPVFFRNRYKNSLIQVCLTGNDNKTRLTVHRRRGYEEKKGSSVYRPIGSKKPDLWRTISYSKVYDTENLHKLNDLVRDAAFMILDVNDYEEDKGDSDLSHSNWRSMRCLVDGFDDFENYKNTGKKDYMDDARNNFKKSIEENPEGGYTAMFYYSVMIMVNRTVVDIQTAIGFLEKALRTRNTKLRAFVYLGLSFCYSQSHHRLGKTKDEMVGKAENCINQAIKSWHWRIQNPLKENVPSSKILHPLLYYCFAQVLHADEQHKNRILRFQYAAKMLWRSVEVSEYNSTYVNNLGWVLMKLAEWGETQLPDELSKLFDKDISTLSEFMFTKSTVRHPDNELTYANLCLLYSTPYFKKKDFEMYRHYAVYYGKKALKIRPKYINGHRDLAIAYIRYNDTCNAIQYYLKSLELADAPYKDREIINDVVLELMSVCNLNSDGIASSKTIWESMEQKEQMFWMNPGQEYLEPHENSTVS